MNRKAIALIGIVCMLSSISSAATIYWDQASGTTDIWNDANTNWNTAADMSGTAQTWVDGELAVFGGTGETVSVAYNQNVTASGLQFDVDGYTINRQASPDQENDPASANLYVGADGIVANGNTTLGGMNLYLNASQTWTVADGKTLTMNCKTLKNNNSPILTKEGAGTLILGSGGTNFSNLVINNGTVRSTGGSWNAGSAVGAGEVTINQNGYLVLAGSHEVSSSGRALNVNGGRVTLNAENYVYTLTMNNGARTDGNGEFRLKSNIVVNDTTTATSEIANNLRLMSWRTFNIGNGSPDVDLKISGRIYGNGFSKTGAGTVLLTNTNNAQTGTTIADGRLIASANGVLGSGKVFMQGGELAFDTNKFVVGSTDSGNDWATANPGNEAYDNQLTKASQGDWSGKTYIYSATLNVSDADAGTWSFIKSFDDSGLIVIDGTTVIDNKIWNARTVGQIDLAAGEHTVEFRVSNPSGAGGPQGGFPNGLMVSKTDTNSTNSGDYQLIQSDMGNGSSIYSNDLQFAYDNTLQLNAANAGTINAYGNGTARVSFGAITGYGAVTVDPSVHLSVGTANTDSTLVGTIQSTNAVSKVGTGTLMMLGNNSQLSQLAIAEGATKIVGISHANALGQQATVANGAKLVIANENGMLEGRLSGAFNTTDANTGTSGISSTLDRMNSNDANAFGGNTTWVYTAQLTVKDGQTGLWSFAEQFDDSASLSINGTTVFSNGVWNTPTAGTYDFTQAGTYDIEVRVGNASGGVGPNTGWSTIGVGYAIGDTSGSTNEGDYSSLVDLVTAGQLSTGQEVTIDTDLTFQNGSILEIADGITQVTFNGNVAFEEGSILALLMDVSGLQAGDELTLFNFTGSLTGSDLLNIQSNLTAGLSWDTRTLLTDGKLVAVPEPATLCLLGVGGLALLRRRRQLKQ